MLLTTLRALLSIAGSVVRACVTDVRCASPHSVLSARCTPHNGHTRHTVCDVWARVPRCSSQALRDAGAVLPSVAVAVIRKCMLVVADTLKAFPTEPLNGSSADLYWNVLDVRRVHACRLVRVAVTARPIVSVCV
jgi:hypothetical protein